jgi:hypothetical protein
MPQSTPSPSSGSIAINVIPLGNTYRCEMTPFLGQRTDSTSVSLGQSPKHAIAIALEKLARILRAEAESDQNIDWDSVDEAPNGKVNEKRFHVILHYERIAEDVSKFEAFHNTLLGNTVIENAEISIIQIDQDLPVEEIRRT